MDNHNINLALPRRRRVTEGARFRIPLTANTCDPTPIAGAQVYLTYDPDLLNLVGWEYGAVPWMQWSGFIADGQGLNRDLSDGEALLILFGDPEDCPEIDSDPTVLAYLVFEAIQGSSAEIEIDKIYYDAWGRPNKTKVASVGQYEPAGTDITGELTNGLVGIMKQISGQAASKQRNNTAPMISTINRAKN